MQEIQLGRLLLWLTLLTATLHGCAANQSKSADTIKTNAKTPKCDTRLSKIDYENCLSLHKSDSQIMLENSSTIEHSSPELLDSKVNSLE